MLIVWCFNPCCYRCRDLCWNWCCHFCNQQTGHCDTWCDRCYDPWKYRCGDSCYWWFYVFYRYYDPCFINGMIPVVIDLVLMRCFMLLMLWSVFDAVIRIDTNADAVIHDLCYRCLCDAVIIVSIDALIPVIDTVITDVFDAVINIIDAVIPVNDK